MRAEGAAAGAPRKHTHMDVRPIGAGRPSWTSREQSRPHSQHAAHRSRDARTPAAASANALLDDRVSAPLLSCWGVWDAEAVWEEVVEVEVELAATADGQPTPL